MSRYVAGQSDVRPWSNWRLIEVCTGYVIKRIEVAVGGRLSLQYHHHRAEHWTVVEGVGVATVDGADIDVACGTHVAIAQAAVHRIRNVGDVPLVFIEVQYGVRLEEGDIVRLADDYARV